MLANILKVAKHSFKTLYTVPSARISTSFAPLRINPLKDVAPTVIKSAKTNHCVSILSYSS